MSIGLAITLIGGTFGISNFVQGPATLRQEVVQKEAFSAQAAERVLTASQQMTLKLAQEAKAAEPAAIQAQVRLHTGGYLQEIPGRAAGYLGFYGGLITSGWQLEVIGYLLLGMGLFKVGFLLRGTETAYLRRPSGAWIWNLVASHPYRNRPRQPRRIHGGGHLSVDVSAL